MTAHHDQRRRVFFYFIEGGIGATKTTVLECLRTRLAARLAANGARVVVVPEPVEAWRHVGGSEHNVLDAFYGDQQRWAYSFQVHAMSTRVAAVRDAIARALADDAADDLIVLCERSVYTDRYVFVEMLRRAHKLSALEYALYCTAFEYFTSYAYPGTHAGVLYLRTSASACRRRIVARARPEETAIDVAYLEQLNAAHDAALAMPHAWQDAPVLSLDVEALGDVRTDAAAARALTERVYAFILLTSRAALQPLDDHVEAARVRIESPINLNLVRAQLTNGRVEALVVRRRTARRRRRSSRRRRRSSHQ